MNTIDNSQILEELAELAKQHDELSGRLTILKSTRELDELEITRLLKKKQRMEEQIEKLKSALIPDQPA